MANPAATAALSSLLLDIVLILFVNFIVLIPLMAAIAPFSTHCVVRSILRVGLLYGATLEQGQVREVEVLAGAIQFDGQAAEMLGIRYLRCF